MKIVKWILYVFIIILCTPLWLSAKVTGEAKSWKEFINGAKPHKCKFTKLNKDKEYMSCNHYGCNYIASKELLINKDK